MRNALSPDTDWKAVGEEYRAGVISIREIARRYGVSDQGVRYRAKLEGWERDLPQEVRDRIKDKLLASQNGECDFAAARSGDAGAAETIVEAAAERGVEVIRHHRNDIRRARLAVSKLFARLSEITDDTDQIIVAIDWATASDTAKREKLLQAVSLPALASAASSLATALSRLIGLERQAFSLDDPDPASQPADTAMLERREQVRQDLFRRLADKARVISPDGRDA